MNTKLFKSWSSEMAYICGYFLGDGCVKDRRVTKHIANSVEVRLFGAPGDEQILEEMRVLLELETSINYHSSGVCYIGFCHIEVGEYFIKIKKYPSDFLRDIPDGYIRDFLRGYFDADGCVWFDNGKLKAAFACKYPEVLESVNSRVRASLGLDVSVSRSGGSFKLGYGSGSAKKFLDWIYYENCLCLNRKRVKYQGVA